MKNYHANNLKYFIYARKSTEGEDKQMASIADQIHECEKIARNLELEIVGIIQEAKSAKEPGRKEFNALLGRIHKGEAQGIVCWKLNRLARNPVDGGQISWMLQQGIIHHIQTYSREYKPTDNVIMMQVEFGMANQYVKDLSVDTKRGMRRKAERGWFPSGVLPIGYKHNTDEEIRKGADEIIPNEYFNRVKKLWRLMATGKYSFAQIKNQGDELGIRSKKGNQYSLNAYRAMLTNKFYIGHFYWKDETGAPTLMKGKHQAMIDKRTFEAAQALIDASVRPTARQRTYFFPYRGKILCGECGCSVTSERKQQAICTKCKTKFSIRKNDTCPNCSCQLSKMKNPAIIDITYYRCTKRKQKCSQPYVRQSEITDAIFQHLATISITEEFSNWALAALKRMTDEEEGNGKSEITNLRMEVSILQNRLKGLRTMRAELSLTKEEFDNDTIDLKKQIEHLENQIEEYQSLQINWKANYKKDLLYLCDVQYKFKSGTKKRKHELTSELGSNLVLWNKKLYFTSSLLYQAIKKYEGAYMANIKRFEPKKSFIAYSGLGHFDTLYSEWLPNTTLNRTLYTAYMIFKIKNHIPISHLGHTSWKDFTRDVPSVGGRDSF